ncbi:nucleotidyltransferase family protein [Amycolatopsis sp. NPDC006131]|uniref:nucleotidyltransferase family protein n=1 Tax=Amycolatopsis sp. NPDC006131 TaxID=3156731 RepID=UPI0033A21494
MCLHDFLITRGARLRDALTVIDMHGVDNVPVVDDGDRLLGVITEQDLRRALLSGASLDDEVHPLCREPRVKVTPGSGRAEVVDLMQALGIHQVPIVDENGRVVGLHSDQKVIGVRRLPNWAVIMAGGKGTRLGALTKSTPKPMLPVAGRPILERILLHLVGSGVDRVFLSVNYMATVIEKHFGDGAQFGCTIDYLREDPDQPLGTGGSLGLIEDLGYEPVDPVLVMNGDLITQFSVRAILEAHAQQSAVATVATAEYKHEVPFGVLEESDQRLVQIIEKPTHRWPVNAGIYVFDPSLFSRIPKACDYPITKLIENCLNRGERVGLWDMASDWQDIGRPEELSLARGER